MATVPRVQGIALHWTEARVSPATDSPVTVTQRLLFRSGSRITSLGITIHITFVCVIPECFSESLGAGWDWVYSVCQPLFGLLHQPQMIDNVWSRWWKKNWQGKQQYLEKISPPLCPPQIPYDLTWSTVVRSWWLTTWAMAQLDLNLRSANYVQCHLKGYNTWWQRLIFDRLLRAFCQWRLQLRCFLWTHGVSTYRFVQELTVVCEHIYIRGLYQ